MQDRHAPTLEAAAAELGLGESASLAEVRRRYRELMKLWHPDHCAEDRDACRERAGRIIEAYQVVEAHCLRYPVPLTEEAARDTDAPEAFWEKHFGEDPIWG